MTTFHRRLTGWTALVTFVCGFVTPLVAAHVGLDRDLAGADVELIASDRPDRIGTPDAPPGPEHCALCHWLQALRGAGLGAAPGGAAVAIPESPARPDSSDHVIPTGVPPGPSRAPPAR